MPKLILLIAFYLLTCCGDLFAQNAFYDAKRLYNWSKIDKSDSLKRRDVLMMKTILQNYFRDSVSVGKSTEVIRKIDEDILFIGLSSQSSAVKLSKILGLNELTLSGLRTGNKVPELLMKRSEILNIARSIDAINSILTKFNKHSKKWDEHDFNVQQGILVEILPFANDTAVFDTSKLNRLARITSPDTTNRKEMHPLLDDSSFVTSIQKKIIDTIERLKEKYIESRDQLLTLFDTKSGQIQKDIIGTHYTEEQRKVSEQEKEYVKKSIDTYVGENKSATTESYVTSSISDQNFPTQSEIIDALAIYISKRFKQDISLTFVEKFSRYLKDNTLAKEMFPATFNMLSGLDPYEVPKVGSEWRNAVSKDLISIPENLVQSSVVRKWVTDTVSVNYLADAVVIGKYVAKKFNFPDMVRSLYLENGIVDNEDSLLGHTLKGPVTKKALLVTYIINEEFFDSSSRKFWITPEELFKMKPEELQILKELLSSKYKEDFIKTFGENPLNIDSTKMVKLKNKYTDLLAMFKQFENSQVASYLSHKEGGNLKDAFWDFQRIFIDFLVKEIKDVKAKRDLKAVQKMFFVYDYISNKNYGAAINSTLEIVDTLLQGKSPTHYVRAIMSNSIVSKLDYASLASNDPDFIKLFSKVEALAKVLHLQATNKTVIDSLTTLKKLYTLRFGENLNSYWHDSTLSSMLSANYSSGKIQEMFESIKDQLCKYEGISDDLKKALENKTLFHLPKNWESLKAHMNLADRLILNKSPELVTSFRKVTGFITDASVAKNSKELSKVLETYAQPPLSYKLTRKSLFSIDLNAYLGLYGAKEFSITEVEVPAANDLKRSVAATGFTVPLGISLSWGGSVTNSGRLNKRVKKSSTDQRLFFIDKKGNSRLMTGNSHTLFLSIIDLTGPVSFRLGDDAAEGLPKDTKWAQILAPGIHYIYGIRNAPICLTAGFQVSPQLRTYSDIASKSFTTGRFQVGLVYDMPLLSLKRKKIL